MIALTQEKREELIKYYGTLIDWHKDRLSSYLSDFDRGAIESSKLMTEIALASLTAEPEFYVVVTSAGVWQSFKKYRAEAEFIISRPFNPNYKIVEIFTAPPVPEIKDHQIREMVNEITSIAKRYQGCQCLRDAISKVVIKRLNGLGEWHGKTKS